MYRPLLPSLIYLIALCLFATCSVAKAQTPAQERIVYISNRDFPNVYTMNADGTAAKSLTNGLGFRFDPVVSPDGQRVLFVAMTSLLVDKNTNLMLLDIKLGKEKILYKSKPGTTVLAPTWSPNGATIFFSQSTTTPGNPFMLYRMDADGKNVKSLGSGVLPSVSPDGKTLLYTSMEQSGRVFSLSMMPLDGGKPQELMKNALGGTWSPDGKSIAYISLASPNGITIAKKDGTEPKLVFAPTTPNLPCRPIWSKDGKSLYFSRLPLGGDSKAKNDICMVDVDGKNFKRLTDDKFNNELGEGTFFFVMLKQASDRARASKQSKP